MAFMGDFITIFWAEHQLGRFCNVQVRALKSFIFKNIEENMHLKLYYVALHARYTYITDVG